MPPTPLRPTLLRPTLLRSTPSRPTRRPGLAAAAVLAVAAAALLAAPAGAATWTVELVNGNEFTTRYQPEEASWDPTQVLLLTGQGNLIALDRAEIARVSTDVEDRGFGTVIDTKTISLGVLPNDADVPDPAGELTTAQVLQQFIEAQQAQPAQDYTVQQFVDPVQAGGGGLPVGFATSAPPPPAPATPVFIGQ